MLRQGRPQRAQTAHRDGRPYDDIPAEAQLVVDDGPDPQQELKRQRRRERKHKRTGGDLFRLTSSMLALFSGAAKIKEVGVAVQTSDPAESEAGSTLGLRRQK